MVGVVLCGFGFFVVVLICLFVCFVVFLKKLGLNFPPALIRRFPEIVSIILTYWSNASRQPQAVCRDKEQNVLKI